MPLEILYGVITFLGLCVLALGGLWVRSHDHHRQWAVDKITEAERKIAILESTHLEIKEDLCEIKDTLKLHLDKEDRFQAALLAHLKLKVE